MSVAGAGAATGDGDVVDEGVVPSPVAVGVSWPPVAVRRECASCGVRLRQGTSPLLCASCGRCFHKQLRCSGLRRGLSTAGWVCPRCTEPDNRPGVTLAGRPVAPEARTSPPSHAPRERCLKCGGGVPVSRIPLRCRACDQPCHKRCGNLSRSAQLDEEAVRRWTCERCGPRPDHPAAVVEESADGSERRLRDAEFVRRGCLRVMQWNADGLMLKEAELEAFLEERRVDVCLIQETRLRAGARTPKFRQYASVRRDRPSSSSVGPRGGGGLLTLVRSDVPFREVGVGGGVGPGNLESLAVEVPTGSDGKLTLVNVYCPPVRNIPGESRAVGFDPASLPTGRKVVIAGDLNAHSPLWDRSQPEDELGRNLEQWLLDHDMTVANDGTPTRVNRGTGGVSAPDVTFVHNRWLARTRWEVSESLGSDHLAILAELDCQVHALRPTTELGRRWRWWKADWPGFTAAVEQELSRSCNDLRGESLDRRVDFFCSTVLRAAQEHVGECKAKSSGKAKFSPAVRAAIRERNALGRRVAECREAWLAACRRVRELIREEKEQRWHSFVESLEVNPDQSKVWRVIRSLSGSGAGSGRNEVLVHEGREYRTSSRKADVFCRHYAAVSRLRFSRPERLRSSAVRRRLRAEVRAGVDTPECKPFSLEELGAALRQTKPRSAAGPDGVAPRFLLNLGPAAKTYLLECLNESWASGWCPQQWRVATIIPLPKAGKAPSRLDSFRPISLTSCVVKTLERMIAARLQHFAESAGLFCAEQAGFRRRRCCEDQVVRLAQEVSDGFQRVPSQRTVLALLDYSKAYDTVWRELLLERLLEAGVPTRFVVWVSAFLRNRLGRVVVDGVEGRRRVFRQGLPQGSVLSPLLFLFFINPVRSVVSREVSVSMYADDVAVWVRDRRKERAAALVSEAVGAISQWSKESRLCLSTDKCVTGFFSQDTREAKWAPVVEVEGRVLRFDPNPVLLGVKFDRVLSFRPHAEWVAARAASRTRVLSALAGQDWGWSRASLRRVFVALIGGVLGYAAAGWQPWLARTSLDIIGRAYRRGLRVVTGQCRTTPVEALYHEVGLPRVETMSRRSCVIALEKALRLDEDHPRRVVAEVEVTHRLRRGSSWRREGRCLLSEAGLDGVERAPLHAVSVPPWDWVSLDRCRIRLGFEVPEGGLAAPPVDEPISLVIFTDGSVSAGGEVGGSAAAVVAGPPEGGRLVCARGQRVRGLLSSMEVEILALHLALDMAVEARGDGAVLVATDSRSTLEALAAGPEVAERDDISRLRVRLAGLGRPVVLQWVSGHCGLLGNEIVDRLAKLSATSEVEGRCDVCWTSEALRECLGGLSQFQGAWCLGASEEVVAGCIARSVVCGEGRLSGVEFVGEVSLPVSFAAAVARIRRVVADPPPEHPRVREVYAAREPWGGGAPPSALSVPPSRFSTLAFGSRWTRADAVLIAQLRSGHCPRLAAYEAMYRPGVSEICPSCRQVPQTVEHWLQDCLALAATRMRILGSAAPPLSVMLVDPSAVVAYARETLGSR